MKDVYFSMNDVYFSIKDVYFFMKDVYFSMKDVYFSMKDVYFSMKEVRWFFVKMLSILSSENVTLYLRMLPMYLWKVLILFVKKTRMSATLTKSEDEDVSCLWEI
jgi:hypothetical protein